MHIYPERLPKVVQELARVTERWLVHNEDLALSFHGFGHHLEEVYADLGYKVTESFANPHGLKKQRLRLVIASPRIRMGTG